MGAEVAVCLPCDWCGGSGTFEEAHDFGAVEHLACQACEGTGDIGAILKRDARREVIEAIDAAAGESLDACLSRGEIRRLFVKRGWMT